MGLDLFVRKQKDFRTENGRQCYTVETVCNLRSCHNILEGLGRRLDGYFDNCSTQNFYGNDFLEVLEELKEEKAQYDNKSDSVKYSKTMETDEKFASRCEETSKQLTYEIEKLENLLIKGENITKENGFDQIYEVHAWW